MTRPRACGALIQDGMVLMVRHVDLVRSYWTLPGGGVEIGETPAEAAEREFNEETGLDVKSVRLLWEGIYGHGTAASAEYCFLVELLPGKRNQNDIVLGSDPEESHLPIQQRLLQGVAWVPLEHMGNDPQVARVLLALMGNLKE